MILGGTDARAALIAAEERRNAPGRRDLTDKTRLERFDFEATVALGSASPCAFGPHREDEGGHLAHHIFLKPAAGYLESAKGYFDFRNADKNPSAETVCLAYCQRHGDVVLATMGIMRNRFDGLEAYSGGFHPVLVANDALDAMLEAQKSMRLPKREQGDLSYATPTPKAVALRLATYLATPEEGAMKVRASDVKHLGELNGPMQELGLEQALDLGTRFIYRLGLQKQGG